jgi:hypothetical protein
MNQQQNILVRSSARGFIHLPLNDKRRWLLFSLLLLLFGCGSSVTGQQPGTPVPDEMVGQWQSITTSIPTYFPYTDFTKPYVPPVSVYENSSFGVFLYLLSDGQYQLDWNLMTMIYSCLRTLRRSEWGTMSIAGSDFTLNPNGATFSVVDTCDGTAFENPDQFETATFTVTPTQDDAGWPYLHVAYPGGELWLEKCRDCQ